MADGTTRPLSNLRFGDEIYGTVRRGWFRRCVKTYVYAHWEVDKPAYKILLEDGTELIASGDHRFLTLRGWKYVTGRGSGALQRPHLTINDRLLGVGRFARSNLPTSSYKRGYLCGIVRGDGLLRSYEDKRRPSGLSRLWQFRLAMVDEEALQRAASYLAEFGVVVRRRLFQSATSTRKEIRAIGASNRRDFERVEDLIRWPARSEPEWARGFLAGVFDAEGGYNSGVFRISNTDSDIIEETLRSLRWWAFRVAVEHATANRQRPITTVRLRGGLKEHLRFFHTTDPAIIRKRDFGGRALTNSSDLRVVGIEPLGRMPLFDITTGTGDFIANGVVSHNCYARPTHEFLGFSAGLDFETRILVKEDAPELLRRELSAPRWVPQVVALSGVTDPYQPIERRLRLTRRCLEVLADFRNPVVIITKHHRVTRDIDVLRELACFDAAAVFASVTTLDPELARVMEPRASTPARRLAAIRELAAAGIPAGVMVAPVIPALTDHELPGIVAAAAEAGARYAGFTLLRLPYGVKEIFERWLSEHYPDRRLKVMNRIREIRGGRLNDSRFGSRMRGEGVFAEQVAAMFALASRRAGILGRGPDLSTASFRVPSNGEAAGPSATPDPQLALFLSARPSP
jgi:DNA repair photolyase